MMMYPEAIETIDSDKKPSLQGKDELNLAEFPIALLSETAPQGVRILEFQDQIFDKGKKRLVKRKLTIEGSETYGLPTPKDDEVILALIQLSKQRGFETRKVEFSRYELITLLQWANTGQSYARIELSLHRWVSVTLHYENAWWDKSEERWTSGAFHIIDDFEINDSREQTRQLSLLPTRVNWNERIFKSFAEGHLKNIKYDVYVCLKHPSSKRMYRFLDKRFHISRTVSFDLKDFAHEHIGLSRSYKDCGKIKEKLEPALAELEAIGYVEPANREHRYQQIAKGRWRITLSRKQENVSVPPAIPVDTAPPELLTRLTSHGVSETTAAELLADGSAEHIESKIEVFEWMLARSDKRIQKSPAGYLTASIRENYAPPKGFKSKAELERETEIKKENARIEAVKRTQKAQEEARERTEREAIDHYWNSLTPEQQTALEEVAIAQTDPETAKLIASGPMRKMGMMLIRQRYIQQLLEVAKEAPITT